MRKHKFTFKFLAKTKVVMKKLNSISHANRKQKIFQRNQHGGNKLKALLTQIKADNK